MPPREAPASTDRPTPKADIERQTAQVERAREVIGATDVTVRRRAADALATSSELPENARSALGLALSDPDRWVRESAAKALREQGARAADQVPRLIVALKDDDPYVRWRVAEALGRVGEAAAPAREELKRHAEDPDEVEVVRAASTKALERIGGAGAPK